MTPWAEVVVIVCAGMAVMAVAATVATLRRDPQRTRGGPVPIASLLFMIAILVTFVAFAFRTIAELFGVKSAF